MVKVFVSGASGNVGSTVIRTIQKTEGFELVGGWCLEAGEDLGVLAKIKPLGILASGDLDKGLAEAKPDVVIDFTATPLLDGNMRLYLKHGLNAVVGTTGLTDEQLEPFKKEVAAKGLRWAVIPNYGLGISLVSEFIKKAREFYPFVTVMDQHTNEMANAPSGTAQALAQAASAGPMGEVKSKEVYPGGPWRQDKRCPCFFSAPALARSLLGPYHHPCAQRRTYQDSRRGPHKRHIYGPECSLRQRK
jgi:Dihydrodipicolinate reductase